MVLRLTILLLVLIAVGVAAAPFLRTLLLVARAAEFGGPLQVLAERMAQPHTVRDLSIPTRAGAVPARLYTPTGRHRRTVLLMPGVHAAGIDEPRTVALARNIAGSGVSVLTLALPDLRAYRLTPRSTDVIEDAVLWSAQQPLLSPDGQVGLIGVSFAGGLSLVAAGRASVRDRLAFVVSFGGHGDLPRVLRYLCLGPHAAVEGVPYQPPHDYGVAIVLYAVAEAVVPPEQVQPLREGVQTFLLASQEAMVDQQQAERTFARAREMAAALGDPAATYLGYVNTRNVAALGPLLLPHLGLIGADDPALSLERSDLIPSAPVFLIHGLGDTVTPASESVLLSRHLAGRARARLLLSRLITHAEVDEQVNLMEAWRFVSFWTDVLH